MRRLGAQNTDIRRVNKYQGTDSVRKPKTHGDERTIKTAMAVSFVIVLSKLAGLARVMVFSAMFGQNIETDAYNASYKLLSVMYIGFTAAISVAFIPIYTKIRLNQSERQANLYASNILNFFMICGLLLSAVCYFFAPQISTLMYQGPQEGLQMTALLTQIMFPTIFFWSIQGTMTDLLDARRVFIPEQLVGFPLSGCIIVASLLSKDIHVIAWATTLSAVLQVIIVLPFMRKNFKYRARLDLKDKNLRQTFKIAVPALLSTGFDEINTWTDTLFASRLVTGAVTALNNSFSIAQMILGILITPITTIMFTELSNFAALGQMDKLKSTVRKSTEVVALLTFPIIVLSIICSMDIIGVIYQHGKFTVENTLFTAPVFSFYVAGIFGFGMRVFLTRVFYALQMPRTPMLVGLFSVSLNIALDLILMGPMGPQGLTFATTVASMASTVVMLGVLRKKVGKMSFGKSVGEFAKIFIASAICMAAAYFVHGLIPASNTDFTANLARFIETFGAGLLVFCLMALVLRIDMFGRVVRMFTKKFFRRRTA